MGSNGCKRARVRWNPRSAFGSLLQAAYGLIGASLCADKEKEKIYSFFFEQKITDDNSCPKVLFSVSAKLNNSFLFSKKYLNAEIRRIERYSTP